MCVDRADYALRLVTDHQQRFGSFTPAHVVEELRAALRVLLAGLRRLMAARIAGCDPIMAFDLLPSRLVLARELGATREDSRRDLRQLVMDEV